MTRVEGQLLHWVFRVGNLKETLRFYTSVLGMSVLRHEEFRSKCDAQCNGPFDRPWSKTMVGWGTEQSDFVFELAFNYGISGYSVGNDFEHVLLGLGDSEEVRMTLDKARNAGFKVLEEDSVILDPNGYRFKLIAHNSIGSSCRKVLGVALNVQQVHTAAEYYQKYLEMEELPSFDNVDSQKICKVLGYKGDKSGARLTLLQSAVEDSIQHGTGYGRLAIAVNSDTLKRKEEELRKGGERIHTPYISLDTPGKATVQVVILLDRDGYEICLVGAEGFFELCQPVPGCDRIDWEERILNGSKE